MLAIQFLLQYRIKLRDAKGHLIKEIRGKPLTARLRAGLFNANSTFESERMDTEFGNTPSLKHYVGKFGAAANIIRKAESRIGPEWTKRLRASRTYSGVSLKDLAVTLGVGELYATHYRVSSWAVHASRIDFYISFDAGETTLQLFPDETYVEPFTGYG